MLRKSLQWVKYSVSSQLKHPLPLTQFCKLRISRGFATSLSSIRQFLSTKLSAQGQVMILLRSFTTQIQKGSAYRNLLKRCQFLRLLKSAVRFCRRGYSQEIKGHVHLHQYLPIVFQVQKACLVLIIKVEYVNQRSDGISETSRAQQQGQRNGDIQDGSPRLQKCQLCILLRKC